MRIRESLGDRVVTTVVGVALAVVSVIILYPIVYVVSASLSSGQAIATNQVVLLPVDLTFDAYRTILSSPNLIRGFANSVLYALAGAAIGTALTVLAGYGSSRDDLPFRRAITFFFLIPALVSAGILPMYIVVKELGLLNTHWAVILPGAMSVFNVIITRTFYKMNIPRELLEAARVDGASEFRFFFQIAIPLSKPIIAVNLLFYGLAQWNGWFNAFLYTSSAELEPLQLILRELLSQSVFDPATLGGGDVQSILRQQELFDKLKYAMIVVAMVPPLLVYPFVQRHFVKGALIGSLK